MDSQAPQRELSRTDVANQLRALGVERGGVLLVHTSYRAVRPVAGGPLGLIEALRAALGPNGTLVMPSWTGGCDEARGSVMLSGRSKKDEGGDARKG